VAHGGYFNYGCEAPGYNEPGRGELNELAQFHHAAVPRPGPRHARRFLVPLTGAGTVVASSVRWPGVRLCKNERREHTPASRATRHQRNTRHRRTGVGVYTITLDDSYVGVNYWDVNLAAPTAAGTALNAVPVAGPTNLGAGGVAPVFTFVIVNGSGTPTEAPASARVHFIMVLRNFHRGDQNP